MFRIGSFQNTPELYRLEFDETGIALRVKVWKSRWEMTKIFLTKNVDPKTVTVFNSACTIDADSVPQWVIIHCKLPIPRDNKRIEQQVLVSAHIIEALNLLTSALCVVLATDPSDSALTQRAEVSVLHSRERNSFGISACLGQEMRTWIERQDDKSAEQRISTLMQDVSRRIYPQQDEHLETSTFAHIPVDRRVIFHCWGDACDLSAYDPDMLEYGIDLRCHNVDSPLQALVLLVGLAGLCEEFEKAYA